MGKCRWLELTTPEFVEAVGAVCGVCLVPVGVIEKHGDHLPLGTDSLVVEQVAEDAVAEEPALLFPTLHFSQIAEARHVAGTIALRHSDGTVYGPWQTEGALGQGGVKNAYWFVRPNADIKAGTYTVVDSDPSTWSHNSGSAGAGFTEIRGLATN